MERDRFLRVREVAATLGVGVTTVYKLIKEGDFPKPVKRLRLSLWSERRVQGWMADRVAETCAGPESTGVGGGE